MPSLRFFLFSLVLLLALYGLAEAQTTRPADGTAGIGEMPQARRFQDALAKLGLSEDQKQQVEQIKQETAESVRDLAPTLKDATPEERREKLRPVLADFRDKLKAVLTPEQQTRLRAEMGPAAQDKADARPAGRRPLADLKARSAGGDPPMVRRVRDALATVGLSDEQKAKTDAILDDAAVQARALRAAAQDDKDAAREKAGPVVRAIAAKLGAVLTDEQKDKLVRSVPRLGKALDGRPGRDKGDRVVGKPGRDDRPATRPAGATTAPAAAAAPTAAATVGRPAPAFAVTKLNGTAVSNKTYAGKSLVLVFASLSSPSLRDKVGPLQTLANRHRSDAAVLLVYTREAHPSDGWQVDRNTAEHVEIPQATTLADRQAAARRLRDDGKTTLEIAVDPMTDATAAAFGAASDTAVVVGPTGTVVGRQQWCDPSGLGRMVDAALRHPTTRPPARPDTVGL